MKRIFWLLAAMLIGVAIASAGSPTWRNDGALTNSVNIDATNVINTGDFTVATTTFFDFQNLVNFTNTGSMSGSPGFIFNHIDDNGNRSPMALFVNQTGASIDVSVFPTKASGSLLAAGTVLFGAVPANLQIYSSNLVNHGSLGSDFTGLVRLEGHNVNLSRGSLGTSGITFGSGFETLTNYMPDEGIFDQYWGTGILGPIPPGPQGDPIMDTGSLITSFRGLVTAQPPPHCVTNSLPGTCQDGAFWILNNPLSFVYTNTVDPTNWIIQVACVGLSDTNINTTSHYYRSSNPTNFFRTVTVQMSSRLTNNLTGSTDLITLYLIDRLASETNIANLYYGFAGGSPYRPGAYEFTRNTPIDYAFGGPTNAVFRTNLSQLIFDPGGPSTTNVITITNNTPNPPALDTTNVLIITNIVRDGGYASRFSTNFYAGWGAEVQNLSIQVSPVPGATITNSQGRTEIFADNLDLSNARIRGEGHVNIQAKHLVSSKNASVDSPSLFYTLGATNGNLKLESLVAPEVRRMVGNLYAFSAVWTNQLNYITNSITNTTSFIWTNADPNNPTNYTLSTNVDFGTNTITTNVINVGLHVLFINAEPMTTMLSPFLYGLDTHSTNVLVADRVPIDTVMNLDTDALTVASSGQLIVGDASSFTPLQDWNVGTVPHLRYLTNYGLIDIANTGNLGNDTPEPYQRIVNYGTNVAFGFVIRCNDFDNEGLIATAQAFLSLGQPPQFGLTLGDLSLSAGTAKLDSGEFRAGGNLTIQATDVKMRSYTNHADKVITIDVSHSLTDTGGGSGNIIHAGLGVQLVTKPTTGDLLGTEIQLDAARFQLVSSTWAGEDRGPTVAGYKDNVAIGHLFLNPTTGGQLDLAGAGDKNGMYVDYLEISSTLAQDLTDLLSISPNLVVYFADSNLPFDQLTNAFPGQLVWVPFAGPNSSVDVVVTTDANASPPVRKTITVNRGLRFSTTIDSDADGIANGFDTDPFKGVTITDVKVSSGSVLLSWRAAANTVYRVDFATNLASPNWQFLLNYTNNVAATITTNTVTDPSPPGATPRYYRVSYSP